MGRPEWPAADARTGARTRPWCASGQRTITRTAMATMAKPGEDVGGQGERPGRGRDAVSRPTPRRATRRSGCARVPSSSSRHVGAARHVGGSEQADQREEGDPGRLGPADAVARADPHRARGLHGAVQVGQGDPGPELGAPGGRGDGARPPCRRHVVGRRSPALRLGERGVQGHAERQHRPVGIRAADHADQAAGHVVAPRIEAGHQLLAGVTALGEAHRPLHQPRLGGDRLVGELAAHGRDARCDAARLDGLRSRRR